MIRRIAAVAVLAASAAFAAEPYVGEPETVEPSGQEVYLMFSAYKIVPYSSGYVDNTLAALGRTGIPGIIYSSVGGVSKHLAERWPAEAGPAPDEAAYNSEIYRQAKALGARLWLQVPEYYNNVEVGGTRRLVTANEILSDETAREAFRKEFQREVRAYSEFAGKDARVIAFEEAGIYHSPQGGGTFWASPKEPPAATRTRPNGADDALFADRMKRVFEKLRGWVKEVNSDAQVGMHLGHQVVEDAEGLKKAVNWLDGRGARPDFIFYDMYLGPQSPRGDRWDNYREKLAGRRASLAGIDPARPIRALHLAQLHTTNAFQNGRGFTPSREELDRMVALDGPGALDFHGFGYYTKNALATDAEVSPNAYDPNTRGATTSEESSTDRWDYGLAQLFELKGADYREWFDVALDGRFQRDAYRVHARRVDTGEWELIGRADRSLRNHYRDEEAIVFRFLEAKKFLVGGRLELKIEAAPGSAGGRIAGVYILPSRRAKSFLSSAQVKADIANGAITKIARGGGPGDWPLAEKEATLTVEVGSR
jgi:hypothetical protein